MTTARFTLSSLLISVLTSCAVGDSVSSDTLSLPAPDGLATADIGPDGLWFETEDAGIGLRTAAWGRETLRIDQPLTGALDAACWRGNPKSSRDCSPAVERPLTDGVERWVRTGDTIEQSWTLDVPPAGDEPVVIDVDVTGAEPTLGGDTVFLDVGGRVWTYSGLEAWDANGMELPAWFDVSEQTIRITVDDTDAVWPIHIDPVLATATTVLHEVSTDFGIGVSLGGDVNKDGYADILVGARFGTGSYGEAFSYHGNASGVNSVAARKWASLAFYGKYGEGVDNNGDLNGDGYSDAIVVAPYEDTLYTYHGSPSGLPAAANRVFATGFNLGSSASYAGDWNNDGYDDVVAPTLDGIYFIQGSASGLSASATKIIATPARAIVSRAGDTNKDGYDDILYTEVAANRAYVLRGSNPLGTTTTTLSRAGSVAFGTSVAGGGDINGDGYSDVWVGDSAYSSNAGRVTVFYGSATGVSTTSYTDIPAPVTGSGFGTYVFRAGDVNNDGYDDLLVSDDIDHNFIYLYHGSATGIRTTPSNKLGDAGNFGYSASGGGDLNKDGFDDVVIGDFSTANAYVYLGCKDADNDGHCAPVDCDDNDATRNPTAVEIAGDGIDQNCDNKETCYVDADNDNYRLTSTIASADADCTDPGEAIATDPTGDCNDAVATINPGAAEIVGDGIDQTCDNKEICYVDADNDSYRLTSTINSTDVDCTDSGEALATDPTGDCDDSKSGIKPGVAEIAGDGVDQNCDAAELCYVDADNDTYRLTSTLASVDLDCTDPGEGVTADPTGDCNDAVATINPGATEIVGDGIDQTCDNKETCFVDADNDNYRLTSTIASNDIDCTDPGEGLATDLTGDCNDAVATINPGATEVVGDGIDQTCDNKETCFVDADDDTYRLTSTMASADVDCTDPGEGIAADPTGDCNDAVAAINPAASEITGDGVDQNCDTKETCYIDADDDTYRLTSTLVSTDTDCADPGEAVTTDPTGDCNDAAATVNPAATEVIGDDVDQTCDGKETCYVDADDDNYRVTNTLISLDADCGDAGEARAVEPAGDCNDGLAAINPGATELPGDSVDQNCDAAELCYVDADDDNYRLATTIPSADVDCSDPGEGLAVNPEGDCNDTDAAINPGVTEIIGDGVDQNCDTTETCYLDADNDTYRVESTVVSVDFDCDDSGEALASDLANDCNDANAAINPAATEICDGIDNDCDATTDSADDSVDPSSQALYYPDADGDGHGTGETGVLSCDQPASTSLLNDDCDDTSPDRTPGATEIIGDGIDNDCLTGEVCYIDADDDGHRTQETVVSEDEDCDDAGEAAATALPDDCDDTDATIYAGAPELIDGLDNDCDGHIEDVDTDDTDIVDTDDTDAPIDTGTPDDTDDTDGPEKKGCGCDSPATSGAGLGWLIGLVPLFVLRRKSR